MTQKWSVLDSWRFFSAEEKRNIGFYILGIMLYKFGLEAYNGSVIALATNRYDYDAKLGGYTAKTFERVGLLQGLNQAFQCLGSILIAPLIKRFKTRTVLAIAIVVFALFASLLLIIDRGTGGYLKPKNWDKTHEKNDFSYYGKFNTDAMIPIYCLSGISYGMVELIRRVIPRDIVGGNMQKLKRMDSLVHIFYEITGTGGAFCTALALIPSSGNNQSFIITPILFLTAACSWFMIKLPHSYQVDVGHERNYLLQVVDGCVLFVMSAVKGFQIVFSSRRFVWLLPGYSFALFGHRFLENNIASYVAKRYFGQSAWAQIMVGGSNFGELLGALFVFLFTNLVHTPIPWLRLDACLLLIVWYIPYWFPPSGNVNYAWIAAATFIPISFGWAAGDVSLAAYIQASLARLESQETSISPLGAVMGFLYSTYIIIYAIISPLVGKYIDKVFAETGGEKNGGTIRPALRNIVGVQFTILSVIIFCATFVPRGAFHLNPKLLDEVELNTDEESSGGEEDTKKEDTIEMIVPIDRTGTITP
jgi:MFS family permease